MEVDPSFETPANRRSPPNYPNKKMQERVEKEYGLVSDAFESLKPYVSGALDQKGTWLEDDLCLEAHKNLGLVMPPIGYEADLRKFRHFKEVINESNGLTRVASQHDIYEKETPIDQGTISNYIDNDVEMEENLNEFGFGYRNGFVYNEKNKHSSDSLLYITHKHSKLVDEKKHLSNSNLLKSNVNNYNSPKKRLVEYGINGIQSTNFYRQPHTFDTITDVTRGNNKKSITNSNDNNIRVRNRPSTFRMQDDDDTEMVGEFSFNGSLGEKSSRKGGFGSIEPRESIQSRQSRQSRDEEDSKDNPIAWMDNYDILRTSHNKDSNVQNPRRESFVSEYSNYTPDGPSRQRVNFSSKKKLSYNTE